MAYDPDAIWGTKAVAPQGGYDPDSIWGTAHDPNFVDPNKSHHSADDIAFANGELDDMPGRPKEESMGAFDIFKGVMQNVGTLLSVPYATGRAIYDAVDTSVGDVAQAVSGNTEPLMGRSLVDSANDTKDRFMDTMAQHLYLPGEEGQRVAEAVGDVIPREAVQIMEALPPAGVATRAAGGWVRAADKADDVGRAGRQVMARGERMQANRDTLNGNTNYGLQFLSDDAIDVLESADPRMKQLMLKQMDEAKALRDGWGDPDASAYGVLAQQYQARATMLGNIGQGYLDDMAKARAKIDSGEGYVKGGSGDVYTSTRRLRENIKQMLIEDYNVKFDDKGVPDLTETPFYTGKGKLANGIENFFRRTDTRGTDYAPVANFDDLDMLKTYLQEMSYKQKISGGGNSKSNAAIQRMSGMLNDELRSISPEYAAANDGLSKVLEAFKDMRSVTGTDVDINESLFSGKEWRRVALDSRKMASNYAKGVDLDNTWKLMEDVIRGEVGSKVDPVMFAAIDGINPRQLAMWGAKMEQLYGDGKPNNFKNLIRQGSDGANHVENFVTNSVWGNQVGATAAGYKAAMAKIGSEKSRSRKLGRLAAQERARSEAINNDIEEALREMLGR